MREVAATRTPGGQFRAIRHRLIDADGTTIAYCGFARTRSGGCAFSEFPDQVTRDVRAGYAYYLETEKGTYLTVDANGAPQLVLHDDVLTVNGRPLRDVTLCPFDDEDPEESTWRAWFDLVSHDAFKYVEQRKASGS